MEYVIGAVAFLSGLGCGVAVFAFGGAAKSADEAGERAATFVEAQKRAWNSGYRAGYVDAQRNAPMRAMIKREIAMGIPSIEQPT